MNYVISCLDTVISTNTHALRLSKKGAKEGTVVVAEYQTRGRGRYDRKWLSPKGKNILLSIILRPDVPVHKAPLLTQIMAQSVKHTLEEIASVRCTLKAPNDVLVHGKKVCGILTESYSSGKQLTCVIVGVGINVNCSEEELLDGATSLYAVTQSDFDRDMIRSILLKKFDCAYTQYCNKTNK